MKYNILYLLLILTSCQSQSQGQANENFKIDVAKVKEITILNKVHHSPRNLTKKTVTIKEEDKIAGILNTLIAYSEKIDRQELEMKSNYGFFEIIFNDGSLDHDFTIVYTIYDGVVIRNDSNGSQAYRNKRLEILVYKLFKD